MTPWGPGCAVAFRQVVSEEERLQRIQQLLHSKIDEAREGDQQALTDEGWAEGAEKLWETRNRRGWWGCVFPPNWWMVMPRCPWLWWWQKRFSARQQWQNLWCFLFAPYFSTQQPTMHRQEAQELLERWGLVMREQLPVPESHWAKWGILCDTSVSSNVIISMGNVSF